MNFILLTQNQTPIIGWVAWLLGLIMDGIFNLLDAVGLPNVGAAIILFTIVVNLLMLPLTIKQQKFSKLSAKIQPEIQAIQAKYKNKKDNDSIMAMNQEQNAIYAKYGVSPTGSCVQLLIQMPILFALYRVIYAMPAYVTKIGETFRVLADKINLADGGAFLQSSEVETIQRVVSMYGKSMENESTLVNGIIDVLNRLSSSDLAMVADHYSLTDLTYNGQLILSNDTTRGLIDTYNNFLGLNIGDSPMTLIRSAWTVGAWGIIIGAVMIPLLSAATQWINVKLMPQPARNDNADDAASSMASSMKMMNTTMPIISAWLCFSLPSGMGLYWIAGSVIRSIQQIVINKQFDKMDFDEIIRKNADKSAKKMEKMKKNQELINAYASMSTKSIQKKANVNSGEAIENDNSSSNHSESVASSTTNTKPGSITSKANLVKQYNERNNSK